MSLAFEMLLQLASINCCKFTLVLLSCLFAKTKNHFHPAAEFDKQIGFALPGSSVRNTIRLWRGRLDHLHEHNKWNHEKRKSFMTQNLVHIALK